MIKEILKYNDTFVSNGSYKSFASNKYPQKRLAILTCMDTRLVELLPAALGIHNGDVKLIKNAGGIILDPFDNTIRSLLIAVLELGVEEIMVIGHTDCGAAVISPEAIIAHLIQRGIDRETIRGLKEDGLDFEAWFKGLEDTEAAVEKSVSLLKTHPLMPANVEIQGFVMDITCGRLDSVS
ncbi:beta-class carbonic anhydrase [Lacrimispora sp.]|uniref:beta-class carbonic anhydrase n=1 Tax=Lacrimispora sp. TaxID=2719234 RepID=UPI00289D1455|nr:carbonic anhydrase [Lacrimispora sp.]